MKNVKRPSKPKSLVNNAVRWTTALQAEINRCAAARETVNERFYNKYNKRDVKKALKKMYGSCCCYCEARVTVVDFPHIEHRKPKKQQFGVPAVPYPELTYDWDNLHLACGVCNNSKSTKFNVVNEILDPVNDDPIIEHFSLRLGLEGLLWFPKTARGTTTKNHADLNRKELTKARFEIYRILVNQLEEIVNKPNNPGNDIVIQELKVKAKSKKTPFGWIYRTLLTSYESHI